MDIVRVKYLWNLILSMINYSGATMWLPAKTYGQGEDANPLSANIAPQEFKDARQQNVMHPHAAELFENTEQLYMAVTSLWNAKKINVEAKDNGLVLTREFIPPRGMGRIKGTPEQMGKAWAGERRAQGPTNAVLNTGKAHVWGNRGVIGVGRGGQPPGRGRGRGHPPPRAFTH